MATKLKTCETCEHLNVEDLFGLKLCGCKLTGQVIPHSSDSEEQTLVFHRNPMNCPRPDDEVEKREVK